MKSALSLTLLLPALVGPTLAASTPASVDYAAIEKDLRRFFATWSSGAPGAAAKVEAYKLSLWERSKTLTGEARDACLIQLATILSNNGDRGDHGYPAYGEALLARIRDEIAPSSPAWKIYPELAAYLGNSEPFKGTDYLSRLETEGIPQVKLAILATRVNWAIQSEDYTKARSLLDRLRLESPASNDLDKFATRIAVGLRTSLGQAAPAFAVPSLDSPKTMVTSADFKGKYLILDFWNTRCSSCLKELPTTHKLYGAYKGKGLEILSLSTDLKPEAVAKFRARPGTPMPWKHGFLGADRKNPNPALAAFGVEAFPSLYLIGPDGTLLAKGMELRGDMLEKTLEKIFNGIVKP